MAKQNVSFIERHVEKIVIAVAGGVLVFVAMTNVIGDPHTVDVGGQAVGPGGLYEELSEQAEAARRRMESAQFDEKAFNSEHEEVREILDSPPPAEMPRLTKTPVNLRPELPEVEGEVGETRVKRELAEILPPTKPEVSQGWAAARIPDTLVVTPSSQDNMPRRDDDVFALTKDWQWVTLCASISRQAQRNAFMDAGYSASRMSMFVYEVVAERQELLPSGQWGNATRVTGYTPMSVKVPREKFELVLDGASKRIQDKDKEIVEWVQSVLGRQEGQERVLRPPFQSYLSSDKRNLLDAYQWLVPKEIETWSGEVIDMTVTDYGIEFRPEQEERKPRRGEADEDDNRMSMRLARQMLKEAKSLLNEGEFLKARDILTELNENEDTPRIPKRDAEKLLSEHLNDFEAAEHAAKLAEMNRPSGTDEVPYEPVWLTDVSVVPGKVYRYRLALRIVNSYAGVTSRLKNPDDAGKLILQGEWSPWSEGVEVRSPTRLVFTSVKQGAGGQGSARGEFTEWAGGNYLTGTRELEVGDVAVAIKSGEEIRYDAVVAGVASGLPYHKRSSTNDDGSFTVSEEPTDAVYLVNADGEAELRLTQEDKVRGGEIRNEIDASKEKAEEDELEGRPTRTPERERGPADEGGADRRSGRGRSGRGATR